MVSFIDLWTQNCDIWNFTLNPIAFREFYEVRKLSITVFSQIATDFSPHSAKEVIVNRDLISNCWCLPCSSCGAGAEYYFLFFLIHGCQPEVDFFVFAWAVAFRPIVSIREKTLSNANLVVSRQLKAYEQEKRITSSWLVLFRNAIA